MKFLKGVDIQKGVRKITSRNGEVMAAVAYWGKGAAKRTGLGRHRNPASVRILCDLLSGSCNPKEIKKLQERKFRVHTLDRLHAKVWIGGGDVIVGSANASQNGLLGEGDEAANADVEAAVLSHDPRLVRQAKDWFERQWDVSIEIGNQHLDRARQIWERQRRSSGREFTSLCEKIRNSDPQDEFHALRLVAYSVGNFSQEAENFFTENAICHYSHEELQELGDDRPMYEWALDHRPEWAHEPGTVLADFSCDEQGGPFTFNGFWEIRDCDYEEPEATHITLLTKLPYFSGYTFSRQDQEEISGLISEYVEERGYCINDFDFYIDENFLEFLTRDR